MLDYRRIINYGIVSFFLLNILANIFGLFDGVLFYRAMLVLEIGIILCVIIKLKGKMCGTRKEIIILAAIFGGQILAYLETCIFEKYFCFDIHRLILFILMVWVFWVVPRHVKIDMKYFIRLLYIILWLSIFATVYNLIINRNVILSFNLQTIMYYTSNFKSFFNTRSNYDLLLCIACAICLFFMKNEKKGKIPYGLLFVYFMLNIILTNARTSIIVVILLLGFSLLMEKKQHHKVFLFLAVVLLLILIPWNNILNYFDNFKQTYYLLFQHGGSSTDVSNGRFELWKTAIDGMNIFNLIFGHGIGAKDAYLSHIGSSILSFHSMWVDMFFEGGILLIFFYVAIIIDVVVKTKRSNLPFQIKLLFYEFVLILVIAGCGDAVATLFTLDTSSILASVVFVACPLCIVNEKVKKSNKM